LEERTASIFRVEKQAKHALWPSFAWPVNFYRTTRRHITVNNSMYLYCASRRDFQFPTSSTCLCTSKIAGFNWRKRTGLLSRCLATIGGMHIQTHRLTGGIYEVCLWDGLSCHDIDTKFHEDWFRHSNVIRGDTQTGWRTHKPILGK
jgi:hypothetical protein